jgi:hypothetical protein
VADIVLSNMVYMLLEKGDQLDETETALDVVQTMDPAVWSSSIKSKMNDVAQYLRGCFQRTPALLNGPCAYFGPGVSTQACVQYCVDPLVPAFFHAVGTGQTIDENTFSVEKGIVSDQPSAAEHASLNLASMACYHATGVVGPLQAGMSNELRSSGAADHLHDTLNKLKVSGTARFARTQDNAFAENTKRSGGPVGRALAIKKDNPLVQGRLVVDNADWENGNGLDGGGGCHVVSSEVQLHNSDGTQVIEHEQEGVTVTAPLVEKRPLAQDDTPAVAPRVGKVNPTFASEVTTYIHFCMLLLQTFHIIQTVSQISCMRVLWCTFENNLPKDTKK